MDARITQAVKGFLLNAKKKLRKAGFIRLKSGKT